MADQISLEKKLEQLSSSTNEVLLSGVSPSQFACLYNLYLKNSKAIPNDNSIFVFSDESNAERYFQLIRSENTVFYPSMGADIYGGVVPSEKNLFDRFSIISRILSGEKLDIITTFDALRIIVPSKDFFQGNLKIEISDVVPPSDLSLKLVQLGYSKTVSVEEPGTFSNRGEIFDIYPTSGKPIRIHYFDDMIEEIFYIDSESLKTKRDEPLEEFELSRTPHSLIEDQWVEFFKERLPRPSPGQKELYEFKKELNSRINRGQLFEEYPLFVGYFFNETVSLQDYTRGFNLFRFNDFGIDQSNEEFNLFNEETYNHFKEFESESSIKPAPNEVYTDLDFTNFTDRFSVNELMLDVSQESTELNHIPLGITKLDFQKSPSSKAETINALCDFVHRKLKLQHEVLFLYKDNKLLEEMKYILQTKIGEFNKYSSKISYRLGHLDEGFSYPNEKIHFISTSDFFSAKTRKTKSSKRSTESDLFAEQLGTLEVGDYVIHKDYGVGEYRGIESLELAGNSSDYIVLHYQDNDKVYVPVYRLNLLQKYATNQSNVIVANLKSKKFELLKAKAKSSVKKLAFDLLEIQAKRELRRSFAFSPPDHEYNEFAHSFRFEETPDQAKAIDEVLSDMESEKPMDRLICGDVGFGKTEVAMRASYKAVLDNKQVCLLVPTTVLSLQHYNSFQERFKDTPVKIEFLSRFKTPKQSKEIIQDLEEGKIDIIIGTHKLLSDKIKFKDLGLVIVDEEQRFGVGHKEKLKLLRETVDTLTLTATPIPRTLQMSFLGIKELSLIKTAPPRRQSIKTYIVKEDMQTIKMAIEKELARGGQVFIVHNKVQDMEIYTSKIKELVPKAKIVFAHGQMSERDLEKKIADFYAHKFDILISTTIIESGIDIPNANTMIIDRADTYGLSQLHQLRGRIGRSDKKAYAYFVIPKLRKLTDVATKRLKALQTYAELGSGFSLASSDLEIRGSGDILGAEQSGHLANIGLELYMELLQEAIHSLRGEKADIYQDIEIQSNFNTFIPKEYIENSNLRLKYYKLLSNRKNLAGIQEILEEIEDQFGTLPDEVNNLITFLKIRVQLQGLGINKLQVKSHSVTLFFDKEFIAINEDIQSNIVSFFMQRPKIYKINPDFSIICKFKDKIDLNTLFEFAKHIAEQIKTC